jgi:hypothetical protein
MGGLGGDVLPFGGLSMSSCACTKAPKELAQFSLMGKKLAPSGREFRWNSFSRWNFMRATSRQDATPPFSRSMHVPRSVEPPPFLRDVVNLKGLVFLEPFKFPFRSSISSAVSPTLTCSFSFHPNRSASKSSRVPAQFGGTASLPSHLLVEETSPLKELLLTSCQLRTTHGTLGQSHFESQHEIYINSLGALRAFNL